MGARPPSSRGRLTISTIKTPIVGYRMLITWGAMEPTEGNYDFSAIDATLKRLKTAYNKPKHLVIMLWQYGQHALNPGGGAGTIPLYIQHDPKYGASPVSGSYGWWGQSANGVSTGMYAPALYYPPVMDRFIALVQALGQHLDADPNMEAVFFQENSTIVQAANYCAEGSAFQRRRMVDAIRAAVDRGDRGIPSYECDHGQFLVLRTECHGRSASSGC